MKNKGRSLSLCAAILSGAVAANATIIYTQDTNIADLTNGVTNYATFIRGNQEDGTTGSTSLSNTVTYTPTTALLNAAGYDRVVGHDASPPVIVKFNSAVSQILVFPSLDHVFNHTGNGNGTFAWDAYQWDVYGSNDGINFTLLFDPQTAIGTDDPTGLTDPHYTLGTWFGTAPTLVNNATSTVLGFAGRTGYEMYFDFGSGNAFQYYGFRASTLDLNSVGGEVEQELSAVAQATPTPEPITWVMMLSALALLGVTGRRRAALRVNN